MLIHHDPDEYETVSNHRTCPFHRVNPNKSYAGCTCTSSIVSRRRSDAEIWKIKLARQREEEDRILAEAEIIKARCKALGSLPEMKEKDE